MLIAAVGEVLGGYSTILKSPVSFDTGELQISWARIFLNTFHDKNEEAGSRIEASVQQKQKIFYRLLAMQLFPLILVRSAY